MKKYLLKTFFKSFKRGGFTVTYWDGETVQYGDEEPKVNIRFNQPLPLNFDLEDPVMALGEAYMDEIIDFAGSFEEIIRMIEQNQDSLTASKFAKLGSLAFKTLNGAALRLKQKENIQHHYDLGNDFFALWLDETMSYSCAYFINRDDSLEKAQIQKIDHTLKKLQLKSGERLLDIGCGWGWLIIRAAQQYNVRAVGVTLSAEQYRTASKRIEDLGLTDRVEVLLMDYLDLNKNDYQFDRIVSVGMYEHVGKENLPRYMDKVHQLLAPGGISLLHTISGVKEKPVNSWIEKYIFPGGYIPSLRETVWLLAEYDLHLLHAESLRMHYALTLDHWYNNFLKHAKLVENKFGKRFVRMWGLYLQGCAASFRTSGLDIYQLTFTKGLNNQLPLTLEHIYQDYSPS